MKQERVIVHRSLLRVWLLGILGLPLIFIAVDYAFGSFGFLDMFGAWAYDTKEVEAFEPRDDILVAILALGGSWMVAFSIKEIAFPRRVFIADSDGLHLPLRGPFRRLDGISWYQIQELRAEGRSLSVAVHTKGDLPPDPWGSRWEDDVLTVPTTWWARRPHVVLDRIEALDLRPLRPEEPLVTPELAEAVADVRRGGGSLLDAEAADRQLDMVLERLSFDDVDEEDSVGSNSIPDDSEEE